MKKGTFKTNRGMKTKRIGKMAVMMAVILIALCTSCKKTVETYQNLGGADFTVTNLRTNETAKNGDVFFLEVHRNDSLLLVYEKPQGYANSKFTVTFKAFDKEYKESNIAGSQYKRPVVVESQLADSTYFIQCIGVSDDWDKSSYDSGSVTVRVSE